MKKPNLSFEAFEKITFKGQKYRIYKRVKTEAQAKAIRDEIQEKMPSRRYEPIIQKVSIGLHLGCYWRVWVPAIWNGD